MGNHRITDQQKEKAKAIINVPLSYLNLAKAYDKQGNLIAEYDGFNEIKRLIF